MTASTVLDITSKDNPLLQRIRRVVTDTTAYRKQGMIWLEGDHLITAALLRGCHLQELVFSDEGWAGHPSWRAWSSRAHRTVKVPMPLFKMLSSLESPVKVGATLLLPSPPDMLPDVPTVVLDRLQDAGNVGSILRSAAAFGVKQVLALKGTAAVWSAKVLRAGMGAHFTLALHEGLAVDDLKRLTVPLLATSSHGGLMLGDSGLPRPCAWVFGHEGQGVSAELMALCAEKVCIPQPGGEESLNVAAAAAICLFASSRAN